MQKMRNNDVNSEKQEKLARKNFTCFHTFSSHGREANHQGEVSVASDPKIFNDRVHFSTFLKILIAIN